MGNHISTVPPHLKHSRSREQLHILALHNAHHRLRTLGVPIRDSQHAPCLSGQEDGTHLRNPKRVRALIRAP